MTKMSSAQRKYACEELNQIYYKKRCAIEADLAFEIKGKPVTPKQFVAGIRSGRVKLRGDEYTVKLTSVYDSTPLSSLFSSDFLGVRDKRDSAAIRAALVELEKAHAAMQRKIMLGDAQEALDLIEAFAEA